MRYNPLLKKWEGNEECLKAFDNPKPTLITNTSENLPHVVGGMVFDPVQMKWVGNEEDDVFKDFETIGPEVKEMKRGK